METVYFVQMHRQAASDSTSDATSREIRVYQRNVARIIQHADNNSTYSYAGTWAKCGPHERILFDDSGDGPFPAFPAISNAVHKTAANTGPVEDAVDVNARAPEATRSAFE
ncbi:hypothetical protein EVAR_36816_1 [Eumeta japonica]|uniref:Uncharacterized protein n=1 Tax=Eumeta variegata TaxID=151549 RepID=A0A4C1WX56_EUMVA|nr:hypothetical protein EVAR_36816_1 [Eumeta japonica]